MKIFYKLLSSFLAVILLLIFIFGFLLNLFLDNYQKDQFAEKIQYIGPIVVAQSLSMEDDESTALNIDQLQQIEFALEKENVDAVVFDANNQQVVPLPDNNQVQKLDQDTVAKVTKENPVYDYFTNQNDQTILYSYFAIYSPDQQRIGTLQLSSKYNAKRLNSQDILISQLLIAGALGLLGSFVVALILSRNFSRRINQLSSATKKITKNNYNVQDLDVGGDEIGSLGKDIKTLSETLADNQEELKKQNKIRNEIIANASHEMRTPLTTIVGVTEGLRAGVIDKKDQEKSYQLIEDESNRLIRMVEDNLKFERIRGTKSQLKNQKFNLYNLLSELTRQLDAKAKRNKNELTISGDQEAELIADRDRITQLFLNIINNSIQFTKKGQIKVEVVKNSRHGVQVTVTDNGIGMSNQQTENIFDRFYKVDASRTVKTGESGLGMAIVKEIVDQHGGQIEVISEPNQGTSVIVTLSNQKISVK